MSSASATEVDPNKQPDSAFEEPRITGVVPAPTAVALALAQDSGDAYEEMASLVERPYRQARKLAVSVFERLYVQALLERCAGNVSHSARVAGLDRVYLHRLIRRHGLRGPAPRLRKLKPVQDLVIAPQNDDLEGTP